MRKKGAGVIRDIAKYKIPRDGAYVTKTSRIETWMEEAKVVTDVHLDYGALVSDYIFSARYDLPSPGIPYEHLQIGIGAVRREAVGEIRQRLEADVLPALTAWVRQIEALDNASTVYRKRRFYARWDGRSITITTD